MIQYFHSEEPFHTESGFVFDKIRLAYKTYGKLNAESNNVIWIVHALTANADPVEWWPGVVGPGFAIDPDKHFIVCVNCLGSHYGSTNALDEDPSTGEPYFHTFPTLTNKDIVHTFLLIKSHLKIDKINLLIGASIGGQQAMEFAITLGNDLDKLILIATNAKHSPWGIAFNESQRLAIEADQTWKENRPDAGISGLIAARSIALLSYRTSNGYNSTQQNQNDDELHSFPASAYQKYQGEKLVKRFNAFSYYLLTKMMDSHNVGRGRISCEAALSSIKAKTVIIGISSDILFPLNEQKYLFSYIPKASFVEIESNLGHDGFLTESEKISNIILSALHSEYEQKEREILKNF